MRNLCILGLIVLLSVPAGAAARTAEPVAIVYSLIGKASIMAPVPRPLRLFDCLPTGTILEVGPDSRLAIAFVSGRRYELGKSRVILGPEDFASFNGTVRSLPRLPPLLLSPIAAEDRPGPRAGAVRIRAERITGLYPHRGAAVLPEKIFLRFQPVMGAGRYRVEVHDEQGQAVFRTDVEAPPVKLPVESFRAGLVYRWTVRTLDRPGAVARGDAELIILDEKSARKREKAREILELEKPDSLLLLVEIDRSLGLLLEARDELREALDRKPRDSGLQQALSEIEIQLERENDTE
jgi:hypothetical protein